MQAKIQKIEIRTINSVSVVVRTTCKDFQVVAEMVRNFASTHGGIITATSYTSREVTLYIDGDKVPALQEMF